MIFSRHQDPSEPVRVDGPMVNLFNMRPCRSEIRRGRPRSSSSSYESDILTGVRRPKELCETTRTPVGIDHRNMRANLLTVDADGNLYFEGIIDDESRFTAREELIAAGVGKPLQMARAGRFLVLLLAGGDLFYLLWEGRVADYTALGRLPAVPDVTVERVEEADQSMYVDPVVFPRPVELTASVAIPEDAAGMIDDSLTRGWKAALRTAGNNGRFVQPVKVRVALRLFDGSLYAMSRPITVGTQEELAGYGRAALKPIISDGYLTGTDRSKGFVSTYRLGVTVSNIPSGLWHSVIKSVEVFVSDEPEVLSGGTGTSVWAHDTRAVMARLGIRSRSEVMESISSSQMRCAVAEPLRNSAAAMRFTVGYISGRLQTVDTVEPPSGRADGIAGAGAFLHINTGGTVVTMRRNNPFGRSSSTDSGSEILAMKPLPAAGGAYTRSYIYLMTDAGITALTHDAQGNHTNCRPIAPYTVDNPDAVVHGGNGVWALSTCGMLLYIKGSSVEYVMSGLDPACTLAWDHRHDELWILPGAAAPVGDCVMVLCSRDRLGYTRHLDRDSASVSREGMLIQSAVRSDGKICVTDLIPAVSALLPGRFDKEVEVPQEVRSGRSARRRAEIGLCRFAVRALPCACSEKSTLAVRCALPAEMQPDDSLSTEGAPRSLFTTLYETEVGCVYDSETEFNMVFRRPDFLRVLPDWQERYRLCGTGQFEKIVV